MIGTNVVLMTRKGTVKPARASLVWVALCLAALLPVVAGSCETTCLEIKCCANGLCNGGCLQVLQDCLEGCKGGGDGDSDGSTTTDEPTPGPADDSGGDVPTPSPAPGPTAAGTAPTPSGGTTATTTTTATPGGQDLEAVNAKLKKKLTRVRSTCQKFCRQSSRSAKSCRVACQGLEKQDAKASHCASLATGGC